MMQAVVSALGQRGDGIVVVDGTTHHVPKVLPGETIVLEQGRLLEVVAPSPERVAAFCAHYTTCGGCKFQHWQVAPYQAWKRNLLVDALAAQAIVTQVEPMVDAHGEGRRRVVLHVRETAGAWHAGFMAQKSHDLVALDACPVLLPALRYAPALAAAFGPAFGICDVAITAADNGLDVAIKAERQIVLRRIGALNEIMQRFDITRLSVNGEIFASFATPMVQMGKAQVTLPTQSFLQATKLGEEMLARLVTDAVDKAKHVADLFCGLGPFALRLAERARVTALDSDKQAIAHFQAALHNTQGLKPVDADVRDLFREPLTPQELNLFDAVVLDPPRAGAEAQARMLAKSSVKRVVMVACDAMTFARDAKILAKGGYVLRTATPIDQFKWTAHLEMVGVFGK
jgi:23S rRNA (uracil1939-C5)-methyltransferase